MKSLRYQRQITSVVIWLGIFCLFQAVFAASPSHGIIIIGSHKQAGIIKAGTTINHSVQIINLSNQPIDIRTLPSCSCTSIHGYDGFIRPFQRVGMSMQIHTDDQTFGAKKQGIIIKLESPTAVWKEFLDVNYVLQK